MSHSRPASDAQPRRAPLRPILAALLLAACWTGAVSGQTLVEPPARPMPPAAAHDGHLVVSEVATGGASASDEFIELYNPGALAMPLEGLELVYVTASGATISLRAAWDLGAADVPPGGHVLVANEAGIYASIADVTYVAGMAATGGSVALRIQGAATAIDAVGWGTADSTWMEGSPLGAPASGGSAERLPGRAAGSTQDTDDNATDFVLRPDTDPQNSTSPPVPDPGAPPSVTPGPSGSPVPSGSPTGSGPASPTPAPGPAPISVAAARAVPTAAP